MATIEEVITSLSKNVLSRNQDTSHVKIMLKTATTVRINEILTSHQAIKIDLIIDEFKAQLVTLIERDILIEEIKSENGLRTKRNTQKSILRWSMGLSSLEIGEVEKKKEIFITLEQVAINNENYKDIIQKLILKRVIDPNLTLIGDATLLYCLIRQFKRLGYFKKISFKDLHPVINSTFKITATYQLYKQSGYYSKEL